MREAPFIGILLIIGILLYTQKLPLELKIIWGYLMTIGAFQCFWIHYVPQSYEPLNQSITLSQVKDLLFMMVMPMVIFKCSDKVQNTILTILKCFVVLECVILLWGDPGLLEANTFGASVAACFLLTWRRDKLYELLGLVLTVAAIIVTHSRTGAMIGACAGAYLFWHYMDKVLSRWIVWTTFFLVILVLPVTLYFWIGQPSFIGTALTDVRFEMWQKFYDWWKVSSNHMFGIGIGSFEAIGPYLPINKMFTDMHLGFYKVHNDWLELLMEAGTIGVTLVGFGYVYIAAKLNRANLATWIGIGVGMCSYYVSHAFPVQILALILISRAVEGSHAKNV